MKLYPQPSIAVTPSLLQRLQSYTPCTSQRKILYTNQGILELKENGQLVRLVAQDQPLIKRQTEDGHVFLLDKSVFLEQHRVMQIHPQHHLEKQILITYPLSPSCDLVLQDNILHSYIYFSGIDERTLLQTAATFLSGLK